MIHRFLYPSYRTLKNISVHSLRLQRTFRSFHFACVYILFSISIPAPQVKDGGGLEVLRSFPTKSIPNSNPPTYLCTPYLVSRPRDSVSPCASPRRVHSPSCLPGFRYNLKSGALNRATWRSNKERMHSY